MVGGNYKCGVCGGSLKNVKLPNYDEKKDLILHYELCYVPNSENYIGRKTQEFTIKDEDDPKQVKKCADCQQKKNNLVSIKENNKTIKICLECKQKREGGKGENKCEKCKKSTQEELLKVENLRTKQCSEKLPGNKKDKPTDKDRKPKSDELCERCGVSCIVHKDKTSYTIKRRRYIKHKVDFTREIKLAFCSPLCHVTYRELKWEEAQRLTRVEMMPPELDVETKQRLNNQNLTPQERQQSDYLRNLQQNTLQNAENNYQSRYGALNEDGSDKGKGMGGGMIALIAIGILAISSNADSKIIQVIRYIHIGVAVLSLTFLGLAVYYLIKLLEDDESIMNVESNNKPSALVIAKFFLSLDLERKYFVKDKMKEVGGGSVPMAGNLRLNKLLQITQILYVAKEGDYLFNDRFLAFEHGGIIYEVYRQFHFLVDNHHATSVKGINSSLKNFLTKIYRYFKLYTDYQLEEFVHEDPA
ncbi:15902_t:CDS:2 [Funneliformis geosporum]|nr:15902_t:CDS:2 [Funneliformis geosporum]